MKIEPCAYCGLPTVVPAARIAAEASKDNATANGDSRREGVFCCLGCRIADGITSSDGADESRWAITRLGIAIFFSMNVMVFTLVLWTWNIHEVETSQQVVAFRTVLRYACLLFSAPVLILLGGPLLQAAVESIQRREFTTDILLLLGVVASFGYSVAALLTEAADVYFEVCCMILVAVTLGKWLEGTAKQRATKAIRSLRRLLPDTVRRLTVGESPSLDSEGDITSIDCRFDLNCEQEIPIGDVATGDVLRVLPGERIPVDARVVGGVAVVDEQVVTGESVPVCKEPGDRVYAGSLNQTYEAILRATGTAEHGTVARLIQAVEEATSAANCRSIRLADQLAAWFVPLIAVVAAAAFVWHRPAGMQHAMMVSVSVTLIACPCALGIATPMALWVAINSAARRGIVFRNGDAVTKLASIRSIGLDKTGTLTDGKLQVVRRDIASGANEQDVDFVTRRVARASTHPLSRALLRAGHMVGLAAAKDPPDRSEFAPITDLQDFPGLGMTARWGDCTVTFGSLVFAEQRGLVVPDELLAGRAEEAVAGEANAIVCVGWEGEVKAVYQLADQIRRESKQSIERLQSLGLRLVILTGDTHARAAAIQRATGVRAVGRLLPERKLEVLRELPGPAAMVGDGLNDAVSLASADVGIALDCGADVSRESADICLMGSTLKQLPFAIQLAVAARKTIRRNLVWAVGYNVVGVGFAVTGHLNPIIAAIAMVGSSLFVLTNSLVLGMSHDPSDAANLDAANIDEASLEEVNADVGGTDEAAKENSGDCDVIRGSRPEETLLERPQEFEPKTVEVSP